VLDILPWTQVALLMTCITVVSDKSIDWVSSSGNVMIVLFLVIVLLSGAFAFRPPVAWEKIDIPIIWVAVYFLVISIVNTEKRFFVFILLFLLINFKMSQHGFFSFVGRGFSYTSWGVTGSPGWFRDSGDFGIAMAVFFPIAFAFAFALKDYWSKPKRWFFFFLPITGMVTIVATSSRGAQLGMLAIGIWFLLKRKNGFKAVFGAVILGSLLYMLLPDRMLDEYRTAGDDRTSQDRLEHWEFGMEVVRKEPFIGIGYNNWLDYCNFMNPYGLGIKGNCRLPHNTYVEAAAELGIFGFALYVLMALYVFIVNKKTRMLANSLNNYFILKIAHGMDGALVGFLVSTIFFSELFFPNFWVLFSLAIALNSIAKKRLRVTAHHVPPQSVLGGYKHT
jgi:O-antigen ligase